MAGRVKSRTTTGAPNYKRVKPKIRMPRFTPSVSKEELDAMIQGTMMNGTHLSPTGKCHECGKPVTGERKFCGACFSKHKS